VSKPGTREYGRHTTVDDSLAVAGTVSGATGLISTSIKALAMESEPEDF